MKAATAVKSSILCREFLGKVFRAVKDWRTVALSPAVGLQRKALDDFAPAFDHEALEETGALLGR